MLSNGEGKGLSNMLHVTHGIFIVYGGRLPLYFLGSFTTTHLILLPSIRTSSVVVPLKSLFAQTVVQSSNHLQFVKKSREGGFWFNVYLVLLPQSSAAPLQAMQLRHSRNRRHEMNFAMEFKGKRICERKSNMTKNQRCLLIAHVSFFCAKWNYIQASDHYKTLVHWRDSLIPVNENLVCSSAPSYLVPVNLDLGMGNFPINNG